MTAILRKEEQTALDLIEDLSTNVNFSLEKKGGSCFQVACLNGNMILVRALLQRQDLNVNAVNHRGETAFYTACEQGRTELVRLLALDQRTDMNKQAFELDPLF